jgi:Raf kinase inhibitor-like YbhB/YbcL family protein
LCRGFSKLTIMAKNQLNVSSPVFPAEGDIPSKYTCDGQDINPPLTVDNIPAGANCLALVMEDPDAPNGTFVHWLAWNIEPRKTIAENTKPGDEGTNGFGDIGYGGPCPPSGTHRYYFRVYALESKLNLGIGSDKKALEEAMKPYIMAQGELMGRYTRQEK